MHTILKALTVALLMLEAAGCGCTDVGCSTLFDVALNKASKVWEPGSYVVSIDADGNKNECTFDIPFVTAPDCKSNLQGRLQFLLSSDASNDTKGQVNVFISGTPTGVQITVARDGATLGTGYFLPSYTEQQPNGDLCGPICQVSSSELSVL